MRPSIDYMLVMRLCFWFDTKITPCIPWCFCLGFFGEASFWASSILLWGCGNDALVEPRMDLVSRRQEYGYKYGRLTEIFIVVLHPVLPIAFFFNNTKPRPNKKQVLTLIHFCTSLVNSMHNYSPLGQGAEGVSTSGSGS